MLAGAAAQRSLASEGSAASALLAEKKAADEKLTQLVAEIEQLRKGKAAAEARKAQLETDVAKLTKALDEEVSARRQGSVGECAGRRPRRAHRSRDRSHSSTGDLTAGPWLRRRNVRGRVTLLPVGDQGRY